MTKEASLTIVIPCSTSDVDYLFEWFTSFVLSNQYDFRYLIILNGHCIPRRYKDFTSESVSILSIERPLFPGQARNIALDYINSGQLAFIDARTVVSSEWLEFAHDFHCHHPDSSCFGSVLYLGSQPWHWSLIASTYGFNQLLCFPGSIIHRKAFSKTGYFLPNVRAGEDIDWIWRASKHKIFSKTAIVPPLTYVLDPDKDIFYYFSKWFRNYSCSSVLPYILDGQRAFYSFYLFVSLVFVSYVWNSLFAKWNELSPLYVPFVSRSVFLAFILFYLLFRCIYLPMRKGAAIKSLAQGFFLLVPISIALDIVKLIAFLPSILRGIRIFSK